MSKGKFQKQSKFPFSLIFTTLFVAILTMLLLHNCSKVPAPANDPSVPETTVKKNEGSISIPGFEMLELKADSKQQTVALSNPPQNNCYFEISLYLEDGTLLWKSDLIEPGQATKPLELSMELEKGYYSKSILHYDCFAMNADKTPLNGAEMKVTLWVK